MTLRVAVTASNSAGSATASSAATAVVQQTPASPPVNTALPVVSGTAQVGQTLTASTGSWGGTQPLSYAYQWQRCDSGATCGAIVGATGSSYLVAGGDAGMTLRVAVTASNSAGSAT